MRNLLVVPLALIASLHAATWRVGPARNYTAPRQVAPLVTDGDTVLIDAGTYADEVATWSRNRLLVRGVGGFAKLVAPSSISNGKAIWVVAGNDFTIDSIEFTGASVPDQNGAGIRAEGTNLAVRRSWFHDNENGILGGKGHVKIEDSEFDHNGFGDGYSHNLYIANCDTFSLLRSVSRRAKVGHEVKSRARVNILVGNWIGNETDGTASYEIDLPNGGTSIVVGNFIQQGAFSGNPAMVSYGEEGMTNPGSDLHMAHNTLVNDRSSCTFVRVATGTTGTLADNLYVGTGTFLSGKLDTAGNFAGTSADLVDRAAFDYRLSPSSKAVDSATPLGSFLGWSLLPAVEYLRGTGPLVRTTTGSKPDIGAWEAGSQDAVTRWRRTTASTSGVRFDPLGERAPGARAVDGRTLPSSLRVSQPSVVR